jgi:hypothetical protein
MEHILFYYSKKLNINYANHIANICRHFNIQVMFKNVDEKCVYKLDIMENVPALLCFNKSNGMGHIIYDNDEIIKFLTPDGEMPMYMFKPEEQTTSKEKTLISSEDDDDKVDAFLKPIENEIKEKPRKGRINNDDIANYEKLRNETVPELKKEIHGIL